MKKIGLLIPKTNLTVEHELQYLFNKRILNCNDYVFYVAKLDYKTSYKENKEQYLKDLAEDSKSKIEDLKYLGVDYVGYFCTSSAIVSNNLNILNNPAQALIEEAKLKNIKKCLLITPYNDELGGKVKDELENNYIQVNRMINLNLINTKDYFDFGKNKLEKFIIDNYQSDDGDIVISCTNLPTLQLISDIEKKLNVKVISSNSSLFSKIIRENSLGGVYGKDRI